MQVIQSSYRRLNVVLELGGDRILVPFAILVSLLGAAAIGLEIAHYQMPVSPGFF